MDRLTLYLEALQRMNDRDIYPAAMRLVNTVEPGLSRNRYNARYQLLIRAMARGYLYTRQEQDGTPHSLVITSKGRARIETGRKAAA